MRMWSRDEAVASMMAAMTSLANATRNINAANLVDALAKRDAGLVMVAQATRVFERDAALVDRYGDTGLADLLRGKLPVGHPFELPDDTRVKELERALRNVLPRPTGGDGVYDRVLTRGEVEAIYLLGDEHGQPDEGMGDPAHPVVQMGDLAVYGSAIPDGRFHHLTVTRSGSGVTRSYVDGEQVGGPPLTYDDGRRAGYREGHADGHLAGIVSTDRRWRDALRRAKLSKKVRRRIRRAARPRLSYTEQVLADGPVAYWRLDEPIDSGTTIDFSGRRPADLFSGPAPREPYEPTTTFPIDFFSTGDPE